MGTPKNGRRKTHIVRNLKGCPRCGGTHRMLVFKPLPKPIVLFDIIAGVRWAPCPVLKEPIIEEELEKDWERRHE